MIAFILAAVVGVSVAAGVNLMLRGDPLRLAMGVIVLGNAVNLLVFSAGRPVGEAAPIIPPDALMPPGPVADPVPQALVLTALVIGSGMVAWLLVLIRAAYAPHHAQARHTPPGPDDAQTPRLRAPGAGPGLAPHLAQASGESSSGGIA